MQSLWSRTLRATKCTCRCQQCLSYSTAIARRSTTAFRKRLSAIPSSTIFYSAIFACAAVADGRSKQQRREKWDHAIQDAKEGLSPGDADTRTSEGRREDDRVRAKVERRRFEADMKQLGLEGKDAEDLAEWLKKAVVDIKDPNAAEAIMREKLEELRKRGFDQREDSGDNLGEDNAALGEIEAWEEARRYTMMASGRPEWPANTGPSFDPNYFPPQSLYATDERKIEGLESRWTRRKIQTMNLSMAKLVLALVDEAQLDRYPRRRKWDNIPECWLPENVYYIAMKTPENKQNFFKRIDDFLRRTKYPQRDEDVEEFKPVYWQYPYYQQDPEGEFHRNCHAMNERIFESFEQCFRGEVTIPRLIGAICEELLVSPAPPNITTYNALLLGFNRLRQHALSSLVIASIHEVHMRPDEITCAAALSHHVLTNDARGFTRFMQLMTGLSTTNYALMLARPTLALDRAATIHKLQNRVVRHPRLPSRLVQKVHPTPRVMNAIVAGLLKFHGLERAVDICATLAADGWGFDAAGLTRFLHACAERRDWPAGLAVWQQLQELRGQAAAAASVTQPPRPLDRSTYLHMLGLCWRCNRRDVFERVLAEADRAAGYRAGPLEKDFEKMRRRGLGVFDAADERRLDFALRADMAAKFEAERRVLERLRVAAVAAAAAAAAAGAGGGGGGASSSPDGPPSSRPSPPPPPPPGDAVPAADPPASVDDDEVALQKMFDDFVARPDGQLEWRPDEVEKGDGGGGGGFASSETGKKGAKDEADVDADDRVLD